MRLSYTSIRAPFNGIIDRIPLKVGSLIDHGTLLTTASDISSVYVYFNVSEGEYLEYIKKQTYRHYAKQQPGESGPGRRQSLPLRGKHRNGRRRVSGQHGLYRLPGALS